MAERTMTDGWKAECPGTIMFGAIGMLVRSIEAVPHRRLFRVHRKPVFSAQGV